MKNLLYSITLLFTILLVILMSFLFFLNLSSRGFFKAVYFSIHTWESEYNPTLNSFIKKSDYNTYSFVNFCNNKENFFKLDSLLLSNSKEITNELSDVCNDTSLVFYFCWDTHDNISNNVSVNEGELVQYLGLFSLVLIPKNNYYLVDYINLDRIKNTNYAPFFNGKYNFNYDIYNYRFKVLKNNIYVQNFDEFNFVFWVQAQDFIIRRFKQDRLGKSFKFYNSGKLIAIFDFDKNIGYRITVL